MYLYCSCGGVVYFYCLYCLGYCTGSSGQLYCVVGYCVGSSGQLYCVVGYCTGSSGQLYCVVGYCTGSSGQLLPTVRDKLSVRSLEGKNLKDSLYQAKPSQSAS